MSDKVGRKVALLIGINKYDSKWISDLEGCIEDTTVVEAYLKKLIGIPESNIVKLLSPSAANLEDLSTESLPTLNNVVSAFQKLASDAQENDIIYIHYSGHGTRLPARLPKLEAAKLEATNVETTNLEATNLVVTNLEATSLEATNLESTNPETTILETTNLETTNLETTNLETTNLETTNQDESIVLVCHKGPNRRVDYLRDVEIAFLLKEIADKGALVTIVLDCCHSGGTTRAGVRTRGVDNIPIKEFRERDPICSLSALEESWTRKKTINTLRGASVMDHWMTSANGIEFLAACQANQKAQEIKTHDGVTRGLLTECLNSVLNNSWPCLGQLSCDMVYNLVSRKVTEHEDNQDAQEVVFGGKRNRFFFGVDSVIQEAATVVTHVNPSCGEQVQVSFGVGKAHGVVEGDSFAVYPADKVFANITDYNSSLAIVTVTNVDDFISKGRLDGSAKSVQEGCKAIKLRDILEFYILSPRTAVVLADHPEVSEQKVKETRDKIKAYGRLIELTESDPPPFFEIRVKSSGDFQVSFTHKDETAMIAVQSTDILLSYLTHLTIYYNLFNLGSCGDTSGFSVETIGILPKGRKAPAPRRFGVDGPTVQVPGLKKLGNSVLPEVPCGDSIGIKVRNTTFESMYLEVLDLEPSWKVSRIYPQKGYTPIMLESGQSVDFFITMFMPGNVVGSIQPERFDSFIILASTSNQCNFPKSVLPVLDKTSSSTPPSLREPKTGRGGTVADSDNWFVQRLDVRVVNQIKIVQ